MRVLADMDLEELLQKLGLSDDAARTGEFLLVRPLKIVLIVAGAVIVGRLGARWLRHSVHSLQLRTPLGGDAARAETRAATIADALSGLLRGVVYAVALLLVLDQLGINLAPLLAGAGIAGIAVGFGAQTLVRDFLSGMFILVEDQYGVGDVVHLGDTTGTVEEVNLRVTRLRSADGVVWFMPNGEIRKVGNASLEWSEATVDIPVPIGADLTGLQAAVAEELAALASDPAWANELTQPPKLLGVESLSLDQGAQLRVSVRTLPRRQFAVSRELRARLSDRVRRELARSAAAEQA